jgi:hypothetical protein
MANKGNNKTKMRPGKKKVISGGFKRKKVVSRRRKVNNSLGGSCKLYDEGFVLSHIAKRHTGRSIRKRKRLGEKSQTLKAV